MFRSQAVCNECGRQLAWFFLRNQEKIGPLPFAQLKQHAALGLVQAGEMVLQEGTETWIPAESVHGLLPALQKPGVQTKSAGSSNAQPQPTAQNNDRLQPLPLAGQRASVAQLSTQPKQVVAQEHRDVGTPSAVSSPLAIPVVPSNPNESLIPRPPSTTRVLLGEMEKKHRKNFRRLTLGGIVLLLLISITIWLIAHQHSTPTPEKQTKYNTQAAASPPAVLESALTNHQIYRRVLESTCWVGREGSAKGKATFVENGTGALIDIKRKLVLTNHHVVKNAHTVLVYFPHFRDGVEIKSLSYYLSIPPIRGKVLVSNPKSDLALVELEFVPADVKEIPMAAGSPSPGQQLHSIGNPGASGALWVYTNGFVRQVIDRKVQYKGQTVDARIIETQSPTNLGDSGGPVVNDKAELVGVVSGYDMIARQQSYFIDITEVRALLEKRPP